MLDSIVARYIELRCYVEENISMQCKTHQDDDDDDEGQSVCSKSYPQSSD